MSATRWQFDQKLELRRADETPAQAHRRYLRHLDAFAEALRSELRAEAHGELTDHVQGLVDAALGATRPVLAIMANGVDMARMSAPAQAAQLLFGAAHDAAHELGAARAKGGGGTPGAGGTRARNSSSDPNSPEAPGGSRPLGPPA